jgi:hypothetical protein
MPKSSGGKKVCAVVIKIIFGCVQKTTADEWNINLCIMWESWGFLSFWFSSNTNQPTYWKRILKIHFIALNRSSKLKIYKSLARPIVTYGCEAWTLTNRDEQYLRIFECRILRKIFGPVQNEDGFWRIRMNYELNNLINTQI